ncbi:hypothetical protein [Streptomyces sp. NPDC029674]|uniref:hypothetical protein n=1 Tax=Streptomyces sp. NPDC029674 TaxID=3365297 RepID=UPI00384ED7BA
MVHAVRAVRVVRADCAVRAVRAVRVVRAGRVARAPRADAFDAPHREAPAGLTAAFRAAGVPSLERLPVGVARQARSSAELLDVVHECSAEGTHAGLAGVRGLS